MKVRIEVSLTPARLVARVSDGTVTLDEPNLVALQASPKGRRLIAAIGTQAEAMHEEATIVPGLSIEPFDPMITAAVVEFAGKHLWKLRRPQLGGLVGALDRVEVQVTIGRYAELLPEQRRAFLKHLPYHPQMTWWIQGEKVRD